MKNKTATEWWNILRGEILIMAGMAVFYVAGYLTEERRRWPVITASHETKCSK